MFVQCSIASHIARTACALTFSLCICIYQLEKIHCNTNITASLLATSFECWMVSSHYSRGYSASLLPLIFSPFVLAGSIAAVVAASVASVAVNKGWGLAAPFDISATTAVIGMYVCVASC
jgi:Sugar-tranasporters, 12 TM